jgi:hypothetical protein
MERLKKLPYADNMLGRIQEIAKSRKWRIAKSRKLFLI